MDKKINYLNFYYAFHSHIDFSIELTISIAGHSPAIIERFSDPAEHLEERRFPCLAGDIQKYCIWVFIQHFIS